MRKECLPKNQSAEGEGDEHVEVLFGPEVDGLYSENRRRQLDPQHAQRCLHRARSALLL